MRHLLRMISPRTIAGQIVLLVVVSVVLFHLAMTAAMKIARPDDAPSRFPTDVDRFVTIVRVLDGMPESGRAPAVAAMAQTYPRLGLTLDGNAARAAAPAAADDRKLDAVRRQLGPNVTLVTPASHAHEHRRPVSVTFHDGGVLNAVLPLGGPRGPPTTPLIIGSIAFIVLNLAVLLWWATRGFTAPLARFAQAASSFSLDRNPTALPERGPYEVRTAARALNRMQERIRRMVEDRTRMLAAVGHDLRTPITRMRLRAEFIEDEATRAQMLRDLDQMAAMIHAALSYVRDGQAPQDRTLVDLASLLQTVCSEFADTGHAVTYEGPDHLQVSARSDELHRAVTNLVGNAVKYGTCATVQLRREAEMVAIDVSDDGPGIPDADKKAMLEPFARGDKARGLNGSGGFGLGLSIARTIAEAHGGELSLHDREPTGLIARLRLPIDVAGGEREGRLPVDAPTSRLRQASA